MSSESQAIYLNAVPLLVLGALYLGAAATLGPQAWRERRRSADLDLPLALVFAFVGLAAAVLGVAVLVDAEPVGRSGLPGLVAVALAAVPVVVYLLRRPRRRTHEPTRSQEAPETAPELAAGLAYARSTAEVGALLVESAARLLRADFAGLALIDDEVARGLAARLDGEEVPWWADVRIDLRREPSAIASVAFEAAPLAIYDVASSTVVNKRLADRVGARSAAFVPLVDEGEVIGVVAVATTRELRAFSADEVALLQELAAEATVALARMRSAEALGGALEREQLVTRISRRVRSERDLSALLGAAVTETGRALGVSRCFVRLGQPGEPLPIAAEWTADGVARIGDGAETTAASNLAVRERRTIAIADVEAAPELDDDSSGGRETLLGLAAHAVLETPIVVLEQPIGVLALHREQPGRWSADDTAVAEAVAREVGAALHTTRLLAEHERRLRQQAALLEAAQAVGAELELEAVLQRFVDEVAQLLGGEAADCYLLDARRAVLRCAAVHGLPDDLLGWEFPADQGVSGRAIQSRSAVRIEDYEDLPDPVRHPAYAGFKDAIVAPVVWAGEVRGVLGVGSRRRRAFGEEAGDLLEVFAGLASLALRNAEAYTESVRQARAERGFFQIATVLSQPLSRVETLDAVAQAAGEALGGTFAAVLVPRRGGFDLAGGQGLPAPLAARLGGEAATEAPFAGAVESGRVVAVREAASDTRFGEAWRELAAEAGYASLLAIPIARPPEPASGLVLVFFAEQREFSDEDLELARHLAGAAQGALERSELYEEERIARTLAQQLARTGGLLATELDPAAVLDEVVVQAPQLVGADACAIRVLEGEELVVTAADGEGTHGTLGSRSPATGWLSGDVVQRRTPLALEEAGRDERLAAADPILGAGYAAFLGVPLGGPEGAVNGVLAVYARRPRGWRDEEIGALQALAGNASAALANAELYQRVALERERSFAILANIADGIVAVDRDGHVVLWNRAAETITGVPQEDAVGHTPLQVLGRDLQTDRPAPTGDRLVSILRGGDEVWLSVTEAVMRDPSGAVSGRIYAFRDISADRLVEQMKSDFVSTVSQELRRPLTSIYGFAETLLRRDVLFGDEERAVFLGYIASESERLTEIVDALLNVARLDTGDLQVNLASVDVRTVVFDVVASFEDAVEEHELVVDLPDAPLAATADPDKLRQVLSVLVDNAVKYSPNGGSVTVAARRRDETVEVSVADQGIGIAPAEQDRIFRKFYRGEAPSSREATAAGTGLGLFIAKGLVSAMGGRIWVTSAEGEGSRFAFELPLAEAAVEPVATERVGERV